MTTTPQFVEMVQARAMQNIMLNTVILIPVVSILITIAIAYLVDTFSTMSKRKFFMVLLVVTVLISLMTIPGSYFDYIMWRDFPTQMILEKLM